jgi:hypothetical protein
MSVGNGREKACGDNDDEEKYRNYCVLRLCGGYPRNRGFDRAIKALKRYPRSEVEAFEV